MSCLIKNDKYFAPNGQESILYKELENKVGKAQANDLFVLAYSPQFIKDVVNPIVYSYKTRFPETPDSLSFTESGTKKLKTFNLFEEGINRGKIQLTPYKDGYKIKSVFVNEDSRGRGLGRDMYVYVAKRLISDGMNLYSDQIRTENADRVWESLNELGVVSADKRVIYAKPQTAFDANGEIESNRVLDYATSINENTNSLSFVEQEEVRTMLAEFPEFSDSYELSIALDKAFYKDGLFSPTRQSLSSLYSKFEADAILTDIELLGRVKESIEKLKRTETFQNTSNVEATYKKSEFNSFGKLVVENPYVIDQDIVEQYGGVANPDLSETKNRAITEEYLRQFKRVPVINENGDAVNDEIVYKKAVKIVDDPKIFDAIDALQNAPSTVDTLNLENKLATWLLDYGIDIRGFSKDLLPSLERFLTNPTDANIAAYSEVYREVFEKPQQQKEAVTKIDRQERDLVYLETNKTEQELFDELSLLQTEVVNVYHKIEKVDLEEMKEALKLDKNISELQAYKDYFGYKEAPKAESQRFAPIELENSQDYLTNEFVADFNIEILKNPNHPFYSKFEINEKDIVLKYIDPISLAEVKAYIADGVKLGKELQEYSILNRQMPDLTDEAQEFITNKYNNRLFAINNFDRVGEAKGDVSPLNKDAMLVKNGTEEFVRRDNDLYELIGKEDNYAVYSKIAKNEDLLYNNVNPIIPEVNLSRVRLHQQVQDDYVDVSKLYKEKDLGNNFNCI